MAFLIEALAGFFLAFILTTPTLALDARAAVGLRRLDPQMRLEQICDLEAMERIGREKNEFYPDRAKSDVILPPEHLGDVLRASGAAFRSKNNWYRFSFICRASPDHMKVISFQYKIGELIPPSKWGDYGLWR